MTDLRCNGARLLISPDEPDDYYGTIIIPDTAKERAQSGEVVDIGPSVVDIKRGDQVIYTAGGGEAGLVDGEPWVLIDLAEVLAWFPNMAADHVPA